MNLVFASSSHSPVIAPRTVPDDRRREVKGRSHIELHNKEQGQRGWREKVDWVERGWEAAWQGDLPDGQLVNKKVVEGSGKYEGHISREISRTSMIFTLHFVFRTDTSQRMELLLALWQYVRAGV